MWRPARSLYKKNPQNAYQGLERTFSFPKVRELGFGNVRMVMLDYFSGGNGSSPVSVNVLVTRELEQAPFVLAEDRGKGHKLSMVS